VDRAILIHFSAQDAICARCSSVRAYFFAMTISPPRGATPLE
jgi:hypothetical protein